MSVSLSFRTEESTREELDQIAKSIDRNRNWLINEAIENYLELYKWQMNHIEEGIRASDEGRTYSTEQVRAMLSKRHQDTLKGKKKASAK